LQERIESQNVERRHKAIHGSGQSILALKRIVGVADDENWGRDSGANSFYCANAFAVGSTAIEHDDVRLLRIDQLKQFALIPGRLNIDTLVAASNGQIIPHNNDGRCPAHFQSSCDKNSMLKTKTQRKIRAVG
jgi:hypothetical protein